MSSGTFFHANTARIGEDATFDVKREGADRRAYDVVTVSVGADFVHIFTSPKQTREFRDALDAHLAAQDVAEAAQEPVQAA